VSLGAALPAALGPAGTMPRLAASSTSAVSVPMTAAVHWPSCST